MSIFIPKVFLNIWFFDCYVRQSIGISLHVLFFFFYNGVYISCLVVDRVNDTCVGIHGQVVACIPDLVLDKEWVSRPGESLLHKQLLDI